MTSAFHRLWTRLRNVRSLAFVAQSAAGTGWDGRGTCSVEVHEAGEAITFHERGTWRPT